LVKGALLHSLCEQREVCVAANEDDALFRHTLRGVLFYLGGDSMRRYDDRFAGIYLLVDLVKYIFADKKQRSIYRYVPDYCQMCESMAICRDENNKWKCRRGCLTTSKKSNI